MSITLPLIAVLAIAAWLTVRHLRLSRWAVVCLVLFGFYLAHSFLAPAIDSGTRTGVSVVNGTTHH